MMPKMGNRRGKRVEPAPEHKDTFVEEAIKLFAKRGLMLCLVLFLIEVGLFLAVSSLPFFPGERAFYQGQESSIGNEFKNATVTVEFLGIFENNYQIALREFIPVVGPILFGASMYATARVLEIIALDQSVPAIVVAFVLLLLYPHSWIELPAYAVATAESIWLTYAAVKWLFDKKGHAINWIAELGQFLIYFVIVTIMLLVAALFESVEIALELSSDPFEFLIMWIPFAVIIVVVLVLYRRLAKLRDILKTQEKPAPQQKSVV